MQAKYFLAFAFASTIALSPASHAVVLSATSGAAANTVTDYSAPGLVSFDLDLATFAPTRLDFTLEADDLLGPLSFNAVVRNLAGRAMTGFEFRLDGIGFATAGSVTPTFGTPGYVGYGAHYASIGFAAPEWAEFHFGNALGDAGAADWVLSTAGLRAGDRLSITAEVPEPSSAALMLSGVFLSGVLALRRRRRG